MAATTVGHAAPEASASVMPWWRRIAPAAGLFLLAPLVAEFLLGNIAIDAIAALLVLAPMYGGAAVLIRETARRTGRGWPTMILLGLAYGVFEEGVVTQSLFNPDYAGARLLDITFVPALGIGVWWTLFVLTLHTVWSTNVPIAIVEAIVPERSETPWLGNVGLGVMVVLFVLGAAINWFGTLAQFPSMASTAQLAGAVIVTLILIGAAFQFRGRQRSPRPGDAPGPWLVGLFSLVAGSLFMAATILVDDARGWAVVAAYLGIYAVVIWPVNRWSRQSGWGGLQTLALAGGALLTYAWHAFPQPPGLGSIGTIDLIGNALFGLGAIALLALAARIQLAAAKAAA